MTGDRVAVIDLGSNTFHLLICEIKGDGAWTRVYKDSVYVKLGSGGLDHIDEAAIQRALEAMHRFKIQLVAYDVRFTKCIGTAALREASNGREVAEQVFQSTGLPVEIIDGHAEASYILAGIQSCIPPFSTPGLIMDIGGGSVEFILYQGDDILYKGSHKIGVAVLFRMFHHSDPISDDELRQMEQYLEMELANLLDALRDAGRYYLVGASGSFEVLNDVLPKIEAYEHWSLLDTFAIFPYLDEVIHTHMEARRRIPEIPVERLDYIVVAYGLIRFLMSRAMPERLYYCDYALKEGVLIEMIQKLKFRHV